jgi:DNA-binding MarR family transcriptional regulator
MEVRTPQAPDSSSPSLPVSPSRIIGLEITGRGDFANQTVWLLSHGPLDYAVIDEIQAVAPMPEDHLTGMEEQVLLVIGSEPKTSNLILDQLEMCSVGTARNCLTRLRRKGHVVVDEKEDRSRWYRLTAAGLEKWNELKSKSERDEHDELPFPDSKPTE